MCGDAYHYFSPFSDLVWLAILAAILRNAGIYKLTRVINLYVPMGFPLKFNTAKEAGPFYILKGHRL